MLMTVLKGELAVTQSKMLIRMFKEMKHILQNNKLFFDEIRPGDYFNRRVCELDSA